MKRLALWLVCAVVVIHAPWRLMGLAVATITAAPAPSQLHGTNVRYWDVQTLEQRLEARGWEVRYHALDNDTYGLTDTAHRTIWIDETQSWDGRLSILAHEAGHTMQPQWSTHNQGEAFAEIVGFLVADDGVGLHANYLARMRGDALLLMLTEWRRLYRAADELTHD